MLISRVKGFEGKCKPTWLSRNQINIRLDGGVSGFFKLVAGGYGIYWRIGKEFPGFIKDGSSEVQSTEGLG